MNSYKCPKCGFFFSAGLPDGLTEEEYIDATKCPCGAQMEEVEFNMDYIPQI